MGKIARSIPVTRPYQLPLESNKWGGLYFDGVSGYLETANTPGGLSNNTNFETNLTIMGWTNVLQLGNDCGFGQVGYNKWLGVQGTGWFFGIRSAVNPQLDIFAATPIQLNKLTHVTGTFIQSGANEIGRLYINGNLSAGLTVANTPFSTINDRLEAGVEIHTLTKFINMIQYDNIMIAETLTQPQIQDLMYGRILPTQFDCRLWHDYRLGHARDLSGNGNHGTINGNVRLV